MKQQFSVGDKAVYPVHGVAEVMALENRDIGGNTTSVYILKILDTGMKIMVPIINAGTVGLRDLISSKQVKEVLSILKSQDVPRDTQTVGPAESYRIRWRENAPGTWLYHCHVEDHMMKGMIGIYQVSR